MNSQLSFKLIFMKTIIRSSLICVFVLISGYKLFAQRDIISELKQDVVKIEGDQYTIQEYGLIGSFDKDYEVKISASAPVSLLSRDNFMRYYGAFSSSVFSTYFSQEGIKAPDDLLLVLKEKPGNPVELTVTISMSESGVDYVIATKDSKSEMTIQWQYQLFADPPAH